MSTAILINPTSPRIAKARAHRARAGTCTHEPAQAVELPVTNVVRAMSFYRELLGLEGRGERPLPLRFRERTASSRLKTGAGAPQLHVRLPYCVDDALAVAWDSGGRVVQTPRVIGQMRRATIIDSEGNLIALYSAA